MLLLSLVSFNSLILSLLLTVVFTLVFLVLLFLNLLILATFILLDSLSSIFKILSGFLFILCVFGFILSEFKSIFFIDIKGDLKLLLYNIFCFKLSNSLLLFIIFLR